MFHFPLADSSSSLWLQIVLIGTTNTSDSIGHCLPCLEKTLVSIFISNGKKQTRGRGLLEPTPSSSLPRVMNQLFLQLSVARLDITGFWFFYGDDEATSAPPRSPSPASSNPFDDLDEGTRDLIRSLYQEEDEACNNYAEETKKTGRLETHLEAARAAQAASEDMALTARAQLITDARVAGQFFKVTENLLLMQH